MTRHRHAIRRLLPLLAAGMAVVTPGPTPVLASPQVEDGAAPEATAAPRTSRLQGTVLAGRREPLLGAAVLVRPVGDPTAVWLTTTGERGAFRLDGIPDGEYRVVIVRPGFAPLTKDAITVRFPFRAVVEVALAADATAADVDGSVAAPAAATVAIAGTVFAQDGAPLADVRLRFVDIAGRDDPRSVRTTDDGRFRVSGLAAGTWRVEAEGVGMLALRKRVDLAADTRMTIVMVPQPGDYLPSPLELMPPERPIPPPGLDG